jgi:hypothetical protein
VLTEFGSSISGFILLFYISNPLSDGGYQFPEVSNSSVDWTELVSLAVRNRVILNLNANLRRKNTIRNMVPEGIVKEIENIARKEQQKGNALLNEIPSIDEALGRRGIDWILIKTLKTFPTEFSDIDILLPSVQHLGRATAALEADGYRIRASESEPDKVKMYKVCPREEGHAFSCAVDLHGKITQDGLDFLEEKNVWARKQENVELKANVPSDEDDFLITAIESFFGDNVLYLRDMFHLIGLGRRGIDWNYVIDCAQKFGWIFPLLTITSAIEYLSPFREDRLIFSTAKSQTPKQPMARFAAQVLSQRQMKIRMPTFYPLKMYLLSYFSKTYSDLSRTAFDLSCHTRQLRRIMGARLRRDTRLAYAVTGRRVD